MTNPSLTGKPTPASRLSDQAPICRSGLFRVYTRDMELEEGTVTTDIQCPHCDHTETIDVDITVGEATPKPTGGHTVNVEAKVADKRTVARRMREHYEQAGHQA
jgi:hypothetical protein